MCFDQRCHARIEAFFLFLLKAPPSDTALSVSWKVAVDGTLFTCKRGEKLILVFFEQLNYFNREGRNGNMQNIKLETS